MFTDGSQLRRIHGFGECRSLLQVEMPASVEEIGLWAFVSCRSLTEVPFAVGSGLCRIDGFWSCQSLRRVEIPASVEEIGSSAVDQCTELMEVMFL
jgi:hypothetical protein